MLSIFKHRDKDTEQPLEEQVAQMAHTTDANDRALMEGVLRFRSESAGEVMTPRVDIVGVQQNDTFQQVLKCIFSNNYSRYPVFTDVDSDQVTGILYIKDLLPYIRESQGFHWQHLVRKPLYVPESKMIDDLLRDFQKSQVHIAIVVDEFGSMSGLVTMEDILEEIVGEINDEFDEEERLYQRINDRQYVFQGKVELEDFYATMGLDPAQFEKVAGEAETLAGLLLRLIDEFPRLHQSVTYQGLRFEVLALATRRIAKVKVSIIK